MKTKRRLLWVLFTSLALGIVGISHFEVLKGPYLIYPGTNTEMTVLWQLDITRSCILEWGPDTTYFY